MDCALAGAPAWARVTGLRVADITNDASHINLSDAWFLNCLAYFEQPDNDDHCVLSCVFLVCLLFMISAVKSCYSPAHRYRTCDQRTVGLCC
jgi:hypothetical protein